MMMENCKLVVLPQTINTYIKVKESNSKKYFNIFKDRRDDNGNTIENNCYKNILKFLNNNTVVDHVVIIDVEKIYYTTSKTGFNKIHKAYFGDNLNKLNKRNNMFKTCLNVVGKLEV